MSIVKDSALVAIDGTLVIVVMVTAGILAMRFNILDKPSSEAIGRLILNVLLPCLLFTEMIESFNVSALDSFGLLFFFCTVHVSIGVLVGWILGKALKSSRDIRRLTMNCVGFQDTTAIPLIFASVLGNDSATKDDDDFTTKAVNAVLIYTVFVTVYKWTISYGLMKPVAEVNTEKPLNSSTVSELDIEPNGSEGGQNLCWTIKKIMNPPIYATLISIPLAAIPYMKEYVFTGSGSILSQNVFKALVLLGATVSPMINILLGCNLSRGYPPSADIRWVEIIAILCGKEIIMPIFGLGLAGAFYYAGIMDRVLTLMIMIIYAAPTSLQLLMICAAHKNQVDNISKIYLVMYATSAIPMALWTMGFLILLYG